MNTKMGAFIKAYGNNAKTAAAASPIFPETILCAAALESGYGKSELSSKYNNFFGIKAQKGDGWKGKTVTYKTTEEDKNGVPYIVVATFRQYDSPTDSFKNYVKFIQGPRYIKAGVTTAKNPLEQFERLKAAGYATGANYVNLLSSIYNGVKDWLNAYPAAFTAKNPTTSAGGAILVLATFFF